MKRFLLPLIMLLSASWLSALTAPQIYFADDEELESMAAMRGIEAEGRNALQRALYEAEGLEGYSESLQGGSGYTLSIESADGLSRSGSRVILSGRVSLSITDGSTNSSLSADTIILDMDRSMLTALGGVSYDTDDESISIPSITADIVTLSWTEGGLIVTDATTSTESEGEDGTITIYTTGETLRYSADGQMLYEDGFITSNPRQAYLSITADEIAMLSGSDMFISNAYLSIGRVPLLYLPFFFFPGSQIIGNPSVGFSSDRGAFLNTTFEIIGEAESVSKGREGDSGSFMSILSSSGSDDELYPDGAYYSTSGHVSDAERWARETDSYIALMADAYSERGIHAGIDSVINLLDGNLSFSFLDGIAVSPASSYYNGKFRYYGRNEMSYRHSGFSARLSLPFYSDSRVMRDYADRLTGFSIFSLVQTPEFPTAYNSTVSSFSRSIDIDYRMPSDLAGSFVSSFSISGLSAEAGYRWDTSSKRYYMDEAVLPSFSASISGKLFEFASSVENAAIIEKEEVDITEIHLLSDPLLYEIYSDNEKRAERTGEERYSISMGYSITENLDNSYGFAKDGRNDDSSFSTSTSMKLTLSAAAADYASLDAVFTPSYSYLWEDDDKAAAYTHRGAVNSDITFSVPYLGMQYRIASRLFSYSGKGENGIETERDMLIPGWNDDTITSHSISLRRSFEADWGIITPALEYVLPPLAAKLTPRISYSYGPFALSFGWQFLQEEEDAMLSSDLVELSLGYSGTYVTSSLSMRYQSSDYDPSDFWSPLYGEASLSMRTADRKWSVTQYVDYYAYSDGERNVFDSILTTLRIPCFSFSIEWDGSASEISFKGIEAHLDVDSASFQLWRGRLYFSFGVESDFSFDIDNPYASMFTFTPSITFSIAEFLDFTFSFSSSNNAFYDYYESGDFFGNLLSDLIRSFDFLGDGRTRTNFVMSGASLDIVHYMDDWDLHCRYSAEIQVNDNVYQFVPEFSIYLSWKILPDLKIDQSWEQNEYGKWER